MYPFYLGTPVFQNENDTKHSSQFTLETEKILIIGRDPVSINLIENIDNLLHGI